MRWWIWVLCLAACANVFQLGAAQKKGKSSKSKRLKLALGADCKLDADCEVMELYCKQESADAKGRCSMRIGLSHPCSSDNVCLSGYCGEESRQCEFSTRQTVVITVAVLCFSILLMAASAPPSYKELYPEARIKISNDVQSYKKARRRLRKLHEQRHLMRMTEEQIDDTSIYSDDELPCVDPISPNPIGGFIPSPRAHSPITRPSTASGRESGPEHVKKRGLAAQRRPSHVSELSSDESDQGQRVRRERRPSLKRKQRSSLPTANGQPLPGKPVPNTSPEESESSPASPPSSPEQRPLSADRLDVPMEVRSAVSNVKPLNAPTTVAGTTANTTAATTDVPPEIDYINM